MERTVHVRERHKGVGKRETLSGRLGQLYDLDAAAGLAPIMSGAVYGGDSTLLGSHLEKPGGPGGEQGPQPHDHS